MQYQYDDNVEFFEPTPDSECEVDDANGGTPVAQPTVHSQGLVDLVTVFPDNDATFSSSPTASVAFDNDATTGTYAAPKPTAQKRTDLSTHIDDHHIQRLDDAMNRLEKVEQDLKLAFKQLSARTHENEKRMATLADSLSVMGNRLNEIATDVPAQINNPQRIVERQQLHHQQQMDNMQTLLLSINLQLGISTDANAALPTQHHQQQQQTAASSRTLHRCGTGSQPSEPKIPRLDGDGNSTATH